MATLIQRVASLSSRLSQLIGALGTAGEQIREPNEALRVKLISNIEHGLTLLQDDCTLIAPRFSALIRRLQESFPLGPAVRPPPPQPPAATCKPICRTKISRGFLWAPRVAIGAREITITSTTRKSILSPRTNTKTRYATPRHLQIGLDQPRKPLPRTRLNLLCFDVRLVTTEAFSGRRPRVKHRTINSKIPKDE